MKWSSRTTPYGRSFLWLPRRQARAYTVATLVSILFFAIHLGRYLIVAGVIAAIAVDLVVLLTFLGRLNPAETRELDGEKKSKELIFAGSDPPVFLDFLYVATTVALTFSMSDVSVESSRLRRIVLFHALLSFFFYSLILSVVANLVVTS